MVMRQVLRSARALAWRFLGAPPEGTARPRPGDTAAPASASNRRPLRELRKAGLRVERGLHLFTKREITVRFEPPAQVNNSDLNVYRDLTLGMYSYLRSGTVRHVSAIGRYTSIGPGVILGEAEHPVRWLTTSPAVFYAKRYDFYPPEVNAAKRVIVRDDTNTDPRSRKLVSIGNDVWIGANVVVRRGVTIGDGAVVGTGAFVNEDVPPYAIVGGLPAKQIGSRFDEATVAHLLELKWWEFDVNDLAGVDFSDVHAAITEIERREREGLASRKPHCYRAVRLNSAGYSEAKLNGDLTRT